LVGGGKPQAEVVICQSHFERYVLLSESFNILSNPIIINRDVPLSFYSIVILRPILRVRFTIKVHELTSTLPHALPT